MDHIADLILNYDPENPQPRFKADAPDFAALSVDAVVVTRTAAEAAALAAMFTPAYLPSQWYEYRHGAEEYIPFTTAASAIATWAIIASM